MTKQEIESLLERQRCYFKSGVTIPVDFRLEQLKRLYHGIQIYENEISAALREDLGKSSYEAYMCEIGMVLEEISYMRHHVRSFAKRKTVPTPLAQFASHSFRQAVPYGNILIMSPWNYPLLLTLGPLVDAITAGNTAIIKPSAYAPATGTVVEKLIRHCFDSDYVAVVTGGRTENTALLDLKFDMIFFTGSKSVGVEVLSRAAKNLTPTVLELGGKSPCIVDETADLSLAARRIVFGKYLNCGQTCVAPDYILCAASVKDALLKEIIKQIKLQYGCNPLDNDDYGKIINRKHFDRLCCLIDHNKVILGGEIDPVSSRIAPTVMTDVTYDDAVMKEEIFGPILPVLTFDDYDVMIEMQKDLQKPLALYLFSNSKRNIKRVTAELSYGGGCINDVVIHLATGYMGFGGVGESGMGSYHGKAGFDAFSHWKSIVDKKTLIDLPMRYRPYRSGVSEKLLRIFLK